MVPSRLGRVHNIQVAYWEGDVALKSTPVRRIQRVSMRASAKTGDCDALILALPHAPRCTESHPQLHAAGDDQRCKECDQSHQDVEELKNISTSQLSYSYFLAIFALISDRSYVSRNSLRNKLRKVPISSARYA
jgi:hypothetical protein